MSTKVITGKVRFSFVEVWEPKAMNEGEEKKYSIQLIIPKSDTKTIDAINKAIEAAKEQGRGSKFNGKVPGNLYTPLRDGDLERPDSELYEDSYFINARSNKQPGIVDKDVNPILDRDEVYSGCFGRASISFYPYSAKSRGIACWLNNIQKLEDGPNLGGASTPDEDFGSFNDSEDDLM